MQLSGNDVELYKIILLSLCFIILFLLERISPSHVTKRGGARVLKNLSFLPINSCVSLIWVLPLTAYASSFFVWQRPTILEHTLIDLLILDFFIYWWHRANHEMPILWRFHQVHHYDQMLDTTSALRFHAGEIILSAFIRGIIIVVFAIPFESVIIFEIIVMICAFFHHSNISLPIKLEQFLSKIMITPSIHWVHHHAKQKQTDTNYGTILVVWDVLFRTLSDFRRYSGMKIGIEGTSKDLSFLRLLIKPFIRR